MFFISVILSMTKYTDSLEFAWTVTAGRALSKKCLSPQVSPQITQLVIILVSIALLVTSACER